MILKVVGIGLLIMGLTGCAAGMRGEFSCNKVGGVRGCVTMTDINVLTDRGQITTEQGVTVGTKTALRTVAVPVSVVRSPAVVLQPPKRIPERIQAMVVFPYVDAQHHYHDTNVVYLLLDTPHWAGQPVQKQEERVP